MPFKKFVSQAHHWRGHNYSHSFSPCSRTPPPFPHQPWDKFFFSRMVSFPLCAGVCVLMLYVYGVACVCVLSCIYVCKSEQRERGLPLVWFKKDRGIFFPPLSAWLVVARCPNWLSRLLALIEASSLLTIVSIQLVAAVADSRNWKESTEFFSHQKINWIKRNLLTLGRAAKKLVLIESIDVNDDDVVVVVGVSEQRGHEKK